MNKPKVYEAYEEIVEWYDDARAKNLMELEYLNFVVNAIPARGSILDLGCGTGEPIAKFFLEQGFHVTGVDGSQKMIELCKKRFPEAKWLVSDMRDIKLQQQFDAVFAWHSLFHLDYDSQRRMFKLINAHLKPDGLLVFTSGDAEGETWSNNGGQNLYHASLSANEYSALLQASSFKVLLHKVCDANCGDATVWIAKKESIK